MFQVEHLAENDKDRNENLKTDFCTYTHTLITQLNVKRRISGMFKASVVQIK